VVVTLGNLIYINQRVSGVLLVPGGAPTIYTLDRGRTVKVVQLRAESGIVEIEADGHRLIMSQTSLEEHGHMVASAQSSN
jgi:hypothetical protein